MLLNIRKNDCIKFSSTLNIYFSKNLLIKATYSKFLCNGIVTTQFFTYLEVSRECISPGIFSLKFSQIQVALNTRA